MVPVAPKRVKNTDQNRLKCLIFLAFLDDSCYPVNMRFRPENLPRYRGTSKDSALAFDAENEARIEQLRPRIIKISEH